MKAISPIDIVEDLVNAINEDDISGKAEEAEEAKENREQQENDGSGEQLVEDKQQENNALVENIENSADLSGFEAGKTLENYKS